MKIRVINGPNINMLGVREPDIYGRTDYNSLCRIINDYAQERNIEVDICQSNHEGDLVDMIQSALGQFDGIIINPGAYTHTSIAILDAAKAVALPTVEVHISDVGSREPFRQVSYIRFACFETITGHGVNGYLEAMDSIVRKVKDDNSN